MAGLFRRIVDIYARPFLPVYRDTTNYTQVSQARPFPIIDTAHQRVHQGQMYSGCVTFTGAGEIADTASAELLIQVGADSIHAIFEVSSGGDALAFLYEGTTFSAAGTAVTLYNRARYSSNTSTTTLTHTPTTTGDGTEISCSYITGGTKSKASGGSDGGFAVEMVLAADTDYMLRTTNISGAAQPFGISMVGYHVPADG